MATLHPFRARPPTNASVSQPFLDVVSTDEARALAEGNPQSFLRVARGTRAAENSDPYADAVINARPIFRHVAQERADRRGQPSVYFIAGWAVELAWPPASPSTVRPGHHQEARAHAAGQGRRSHQAYARAWSSDVGVLTYRARTRSTRGGAGDKGPVISFTRRPGAARCGGLAAPSRRARGGGGHPALSPTATIARPAPHARADARALAAGNVAR